VTWTRIEARVGAGVPDINGAMTQGEFWIENKVCKNKGYKTEGLWLPSQIAWQFSRSKVYANVWNLVSHPSDEKLYLYNGSKILELNDVEGPIPEPCLVITYPVDWDLMIKHISETLTQISTAMDYECANV
jgi:hypothetical protein